MLVRIVATSSVVPQVELSMGVEKLRAAGFSVEAHATCGSKHQMFAGTDEDRAAALLECARDPFCEIIWCARGGYGAYRLLRRTPGRLRASSSLDFQT
jgi:muramoyltetrapeptide carboxypeptidase